MGGILNLEGSQVRLKYLANNFGLRSYAGTGTSLDETEWPAGRYLKRVNGCVVRKSTTRRMN